METIKVTIQGEFKELKAGDKIFKVRSVNSLGQFRFVSELEGVITKIGPTMVFAKFGDRDVKMNHQLNKSYTPNGYFLGSGEQILDEETYLKLKSRSDETIENSKILSKFGDLVTANKLNPNVLSRNPEIKKLVIQLMAELEGK